MTAPSHVPLTIVAVDDEPLALARLELYLQEIKGVRLAGSFSDPEEAVAFVLKRRPDLLLLDVEMPGISGLQLASQLRQVEEPRPSVIFVTAFAHHAIGAFEAQAVDYVLKPVTQSRLEAAIERIRDLVDRERTSARVRELERCLAESRHDPEKTGDEHDRQKIWALRGNEFVQLRIGEIERVESDRDYVHIHNAERAYHLRTTLGALHERLGSDRYVRIRRSAIVRLDSIGAIRDRGYGDLQIILHSGTVLQVGRTYLKSLRERLRKWPGAEEPLPRPDPELRIGPERSTKTVRWP